MRGARIEGMADGVRVLGELPHVRRALVLQAAAHVMKQGRPSDYIPPQGVDRQPTGSGCVGAREGRHVAGAVSSAVTGVECLQGRGSGSAQTDRTGNATAGGDGSSAVSGIDYT
ncbi:hypothetical protein SM007_38940 [Streptomyces avermitilis]|uniref:Uncharacterized protein n=1 Tax=Streptomyces avermitilis TaxID=33903 RepID=A0A4D4N4H2_STRAX|nr:hypothetical protein SM007_38940 [Streptomyces avermitilis]BBJ48462.1 hypothetical protein SAVMC3_10910 [Streptomyces avermitilis]GDY69179.1 hypothetical protein SAV14893_085720 [Streptomyces avermitilis]GDY79428.1 hypothetical protein SAV31267_089130 [Streptomyces avermitilis]GDY88332.1 hypothetical protein SAVCW2_75310 [Streptomyces avermitilis]